MAVQWLDGQADEKICPMRHIRQKQWQTQWNLGSCTYDYISDYECIFNHPIDLFTRQAYNALNPTGWANLQLANQQGTKIPITNLAHFTNQETAETIITSGGFCGGLKKINVEVSGQDITDIKANLSWWSPIFTPHDRAQVCGTIGAAILPFLGPEDDYDTLQNQFATFDAFIPKSWRYGPCYLQRNMNDLFQCYSNQFGGVQFKILGTFGYKAEIMHAVLVCNQANGAGMFAAYPDVLTPEQDTSTGSGAVVTRDAMGNWVWKPQATGTEIIRLSDRTVIPCIADGKTWPLHFIYPSTILPGSFLNWVIIYCNCPELVDNRRKLKEKLCGLMVKRKHVYFKFQG